MQSGVGAGQRACVGLLLPLHICPRILFKGELREWAETSRGSVLLRAGG
jgi:hypothetical protein